MTREEQIEEILYEAHAYGMREKVLSTASKLIRENPKMDKIEAYQQAYNNCIKDEWRRNKKVSWWNIV